MEPAEFERIMEHQFDVCARMLGAKAEEYAPGVDRLHNFRVAATVRNTTPAQALAGMMLKHTVSIYDAIDADVLPPLFLLEEKITDHINYLVLLMAIFRDEDLSMDRNNQADTPTNKDEDS